jgi:hypothetical protein
MFCIVRESDQNPRFQEWYLSRRRLIFTDNMVHFSCSYAGWREDIVPDLSPSARKSTPLGDGNPTLKAAPSSHGIYFDMTDVPRQYSHREIRDQEEWLKALAGIQRRRSKIWKCGFLEGLPTVAFDLFLGFQRKHLADVYLRRREAFPSYSWAGWQGPIDYMTDVNCILGVEGETKWLNDATWIVWYVRSAEGELNRISDLDGDTRTQPPSELYERFPFFADEKLLLPVDSVRVLPSPQLPATTRLHSYPMLQFWTMVTYYAVPEIHGLEKCVMWGFSDGHWRPVGGVVLDEDPGEGIKPGEMEFVVLAKSHLAMTTPPQKRTLESDRFGYLDKRLEEGEFEDYPPFPDEETGRQNDDGFGRGDPKAYMVMMAKWENGVAVRKGIGELWQGEIKASLPPGPVWKEIVLG